MHSKSKYTGFLILWIKKMEEVHSAFKAEAFLI